MATTPKVLLKRSSVIGRVPSAGDLEYGELAINFADGKIYYKDASNSINAFVDSARVQAIANAVEATAQAQLDSSEVTALIDSAYVQARQDYDWNSLENIPSYVISLDSAEIARLTLDSAEITSLIDSSHVRTRQDYAYSSLTGTPYIPSLGNDYVDSAYVTGLPVSTFTNDANYLDSSTVTGVIDTVYITGLIDTTYLDSAEAIALIDSSYIQARIDKAFIDGLNIDADTLDGQDGSWYLDWTNTTNKPVILDIVDVQNIIDSDHVQARIDQAYISSLNPDADTLDGLDATQFLRSDQSDSMQGSLTIDSNLTVGGYIAGPSTFYIDPAGVGDNTGRVIIRGDLQVDGTETIVNSTTVSINDKNIILADSAADSATADGAGITVNGANATIQYDAVDDEWEFNKDISAPNLTTGSVSATTISGVYTGFDSDFAQKTTNDLTEGSTNLYYTTARHDSDTLVLVDSAYVQARQLNFDNLLDSAEVVDLVDSAYVQARMGTTTNLPEGTNLYYVKSRVDSDIAASLNDSGNTVTITINNVITDTVDSAYVLARIAEAPFLDSADALGLIDSSYVQLRAIGLDYNVLSNKPALIDSNLVSQFIDSAYVQARQVDIYRDSGFVTGIVDSAYVQARVSFETSGYSALKLMSASTDNVADTFTWTFDTEAQAENFREIVHNTKQNGSTAGTNMFFYDASGYFYRFGPNISATPVRHYQATRSGTSVVVGWDSSPTDMFTATSNPSGFPAAGVDLIQMRSIHDPTNPGGPTDRYEIGETFTASDIAAEYYGESAQVFGVLTTSDFNTAVSSIILTDVDSAYVQLRQDYAYSSLTGAPTNVSSFTNDANYIATGDSASLSSVTTTGDVVVGGNLQVNGTTFTVNSETLAVGDNLIYMNQLESAGSPTLQVDVGWAANVNDNGSYTHVGMFRDATDDTFKVFGSYAPEPDSAVQIDTGHASFELAPFAAKTLSGEYLGFDSDLATKTTDDLTEGSNLYYTDARVQTLVDSAYIQLRQAPGTDSAAVISIVTSTVDSAYIQARQADIYRDSGFVTGIIDSAYINARVSTTDSAQVISIINATVDSAYIQLRDRFRDSNFVTQIVDSAYIQLRDRFQEDSNFVTNIVDSSYIQARQSGVDSAAIIQLVDSAYINARVAAGTDSATVSAIILSDVDSAYVQARQLNETAAPLTQSTYNFTATVGQTSFTGLSIDSDKFQVYLNGLLLPRADYTHNTSKVDLAVAADSGDVLEVLKFTGNDTGAQAIQQRHYIYTATSGQTVFSGADDNSATLSYTQGRINVYLNGLLLLDSDDYTQNASGTTVTFTSGVTAGHIVDIQTLSGNTGTFAPLEQTLYEFTADSGQTVFTGTDNNAATLDFSNDKITVYLNGILLSSSDYTPSGGDTITLDVGADSGNLLTVAKLSGNNIGLDSAQVNALISASGPSGVDSAAIIALVDSAYIQARQVDIYRDSGFVTGIVDSAYIQARTLAGTDSAATQAMIDSNFLNVGSHFIPALDSTYDLGTASKKWKDLYLSGNSIYLGGHNIHTQGNSIRLIDSTGALVNITAANVLDSADVIGIIASETLDSALITALVDSAYIQLRDRFQDSAGVIQLVDSALVQLKAIGLDYNVLSNTPASGLANVVEDTTPQLGGPLEGNGFDIFLSDDDILAWGASPGRTNIKGKASTSYSTNHITLNVRSGSSQSTEVAKFTTSDGLYTTIGLNFANWNTALNGYYDLKIQGPTQNSLSANELIRFPESSGTVALTKDVLDSADITNLIDSAYIQARQTTGGGGTVDSAYVLSVVDSAAVPFSQTFYHFTADSGQITFSGFDDDSDTLAYTAGSLAVYLNGILLVDSVDYIANNGTSIILNDSAALGDVLTILKFGGNSVGLDSAGVINLIDSAYIQARQADIYRDSGFVTGIIDSAYIIARTTAGTDSAAIIQLIDSAYVQARQVDVYRDSAFVDLVIEKHLDLGEFILGGDPGVLQYVDFVSQVAGTNGAVRAGTGLSKTGGTGWTAPAYFSVDSSFVTGLIDSAYIQARDRYRDSAFITNIIDSAYVEARQTNVFNRVYVSGQTEFNADSTRDQIIFEAGTGITLTTDANTDTLTITGHDPAFPDSASVVTVIENLVDSAYVQLRQSAVAGGGGGTDSATVVTLIQSTVDSDYIGTKVDFTRGEFVNEKSQYTATASQTVFNHSSIDPTHLDVYLNGILQVVNDDYTANSSAVTFTTGVDSGYSVTIVEKRGRVLTQRGLVESKYYFTTPTPTTSITGTDDNGATLDYSDGFLDVYLNGILLKDSDDYSTNAGTTVTLVSATDSNDLVTLINRKGVVVSPNVKNYEFTATAGQTTFSGADINSNTLSYVPGAVQVHLNGILLRNADFTAVNGTSVTLADSASLNDELVVSAFSNPGQNMDLYKFTADSGQTIFSGNDLTGASLAYQPGNIQVFMNGLLLNDSDDYTAINGMSVVLTSGADLSDEIKIASFVNNRDNLRTNAWSAPTGTPVQATAGDKLFIDTSSAKTVTLPSSASMGDEIRIIDATGNAATNNITVGRNGHKIQGSATDLTININRAGIGLVYYNAAQGWVLIEN